ncbi:C-type mannose receptor 2 [Lampris incognitus]|uniref:C-type mannose receptor 2 n=1 Tax=Lampris incognitus TaxID=2546036 RepID=UPI0024B52BDB|nr:C-type mannose receptor 2 [Lampris incognitus]
MMRGSQSLWLLLISGFSFFTFVSSEFHFVDMFKSYAEAKRFCRETYTDLATVGNSTEMDSLVSLVPSDQASAWIGLEAGDVPKWHWSLPNQRLDFLNWKAGEPRGHQQDACAAMNPAGEWFESDCNTKRRFICDGLGGTTVHSFIDGTKSWRDAQNHCRDLSTELVSIQSRQKNRAVQNVSLSQTVWIGLFKDPWRWSDGSNTTFRFWRPRQPNYLTNQRCAAAIFKHKGEWNDVKCNSSRKFICQGAKKPPIPATTKQTSTSTQQAVTTTKLLSSQTLLPVSSSQNTKTTLSTTTSVPPSTEFTVSITTVQATTPFQNKTSIFEPTTLHITEPASINNSLHSTTTQNTTVAETQYSLPTSTMQITTESGTESTALSTLDRTTTYSTAEASTVMPTEYTQGWTTDKFILIQENMTWNEAMSYCREHHVDLVSVTTEEMQAWVSSHARNATSSHVWLGLRYSCSFNFWFWISSHTGCYQNWAPGHGAERQYGCGVAGAMKATRGQQWVGLPETDELNFICYACG